jgi:hypothetical protein
MFKTVLVRLAIWSLPAVAVTLLVSWGIIRLSGKQITAKPATAEK